MGLSLSIAMANNPRTRALFDGRVKPEGIDPVCLPVPVSELFWRQLSFAEFDVSEMSMSSLMMAVAGGDTRWVGLPIFTTRRMFHTAILVRKDRAIVKPEDLKGKKIGVPEYQQTSALWTRGVLQQEWAVRQQDIAEWWMERNPDHSQGGQVGFTPPTGVNLSYIPTATNLGDMLLEGKLDGALQYLFRTNNVVDRSTADLYNHPDFKTLFTDPQAEAARYYKKTGLYPINHGMIVKREIAEKHPWVVLNLMNAFNQANEIAETERKQAIHAHVEIGLFPKELAKALAVPLITHGIAANRKVLEMTAQFSYDQGLTSRLMKLEELFAPSAMDL